MFRVFSVTVFQGNGRTLRQSRAARLLLNAHTEQRVSLQMLPRSFIDARSGSRVQRDELMTVLADVAALRVRAQLEDSAEGTLRSHGGLAHTNIKDKSSVWRLWCLWHVFIRAVKRLITSFVYIIYLCVYIIYIYIYMDIMVSSLSRCFYFLSILS